MSDASFYSTGSWQPFAGQEDQFLEAWTEFSSWAAALPGAGGTPVMVRDLRTPERFVSFMPWESLEAIQGWKAHGEFKERMSRVQAFVDKFAPTEGEVVARARPSA